jgi:hypothetical protein
VEHDHAWKAVRDPRDVIESILALDLPAYQAAIGTLEDLGPELEAAGLGCGRCGDGRCARRHGFRCRKRITDLSTGAVFEELPIRRVLFCNGTTVSLVPAQLWRGRCTISSVLETVVRVHRDGIEATSEWALYAGTGEEMVSERSLRRWRDLIRTRLFGSAFSWLGPKLGLAWSGKESAGDQLEALLDRLNDTILLGFRALTGRALLDKAPDSSLPTCSSAPRVPGRLVPDPPHTPPSSRRPRGSWWPHRPREGPGHDAQEERSPPEKDESP